jgi:hypothetical protein
MVVVSLLHNPVFAVDVASAINCIRDIPSLLEGQHTDCFGIGCSIKPNLVQFMSQDSLLAIGDECRGAQS